MDGSKLFDSKRYQTWVLDKKILHKLQSNKEELKEDCYGYHRKTNTWIRQKTKIPDLTQRINGSGQDMWSDTTNTGSGKSLDGAPEDKKEK